MGGALRPTVGKIYRAGGAKFNVGGYDFYHQLIIKISSAIIHYLLEENTLEMALPYLDFSIFSEKT